MAQVRLSWIVGRSRGKMLAAIHSTVVGVQNELATLSYSLAIHWFGIRLYIGQEITLAMGSHSAFLLPGCIARGWFFN